MNFIYRSEVEKFIEKQIPTETITVKKKPSVFVASRKIYNEMCAASRPPLSYERLEYNGIKIYSEDEVVYLKEGKV